MTNNINKLESAKKNMKVSQFYNTNQFIIKTNGSTVFQSYDSVVAVIDENGLTLGCDWDYSHTTLKHLYLFINDYVHARELRSLNEQKNKRAFIQKLIDSNIIKYDEELI